MKFLKKLFGMSDSEGFATDSLTGEWNGHYTQHGERHRIKALFTQDGRRLVGQMTDIDTVTEQSLYDAVADAGLPPGADEQIAERIYGALPDQPIGPIRTRSVLPSASKLEGTVSGEFVRFTKTYQGQSLYMYEMGDQGVGHARDGHSVEYSGRISSDGTTVSGQWVIYQPEIPKGFIDGNFELHRSW